MSVGQIIAGAFANALLRRAAREGEPDAEPARRVRASSSAARSSCSEVLQTVGRRLCAAAAAPLCDIYVVEGEQLRLRRLHRPRSAGRGVRGHDVPPRRPGARPRGAVTAASRVVVTDLTTDARISEWERPEELRWGNRSKIELPLVSRGQVIGIAGVFDDHVREFEGLDMLQSLAQVAANALANATVYDRLDRSAERMALVNDVSSELSSLLDLDEVLRSAATRLCAIAGVPACDLYRLRGDELVNLVSISDGEVDRQLGRPDIPAERVGRAVQGRRRATAGARLHSRRPLAPARRTRRDGALGRDRRAHGAAHRQGPRHRRARAPRAPRRTRPHAGRDRHHLRREPRRGAGHRERRPRRRPAAAQPGDRAAQRPRARDRRRASSCRTSPRARSRSCARSRPSNAPSSACCATATSWKWRSPAKGVRSHSPTSSTCRLTAQLLERLEAEGIVTLEPARGPAGRLRPPWARRPRDRACSSP